MEQVNADYIRKHLTGRRGEMADLARAMGIDDSKLSKIMSGNRKVQASEVPAVVGFFERGIAEPVGVPADPTAAPTLIPVYDVRAAAGGGAVAPEYEAIADQLSFPPGYLHHITRTSPDKLAIISVTGASMVPTLYHDDIVMVDMTKTNMAYDGMFVVRHDGLLRVKRLQKARDRKSVILHSDNDREFPPEEVPGEEVEIVGRVVWSGKKHP